MSCYNIFSVSFETQAVDFVPYFFSIQLAMPDATKTYKPRDMGGFVMVFVLLLFFLKSVL